MEPDLKQDNVREGEQPDRAEQLESAAESGGRKKRKKSFWREVGEWAASLLAAVVIVLIIQNFLFTLIRVDGNSMYDTLHDGERLFVTVADVKFGSGVERGAVVICNYPNRGRTFFVKRVYTYIYWRHGLPRGRRDARGLRGRGRQWRDGGRRRAAGRGVRANLLRPGGRLCAYKLGEDEYFVVGDNRGNSHDSRDWNDSDPSRDVGPITKDMIIGRVRLYVYLFEIRGVE